MQKTRKPSTGIRSKLEKRGAVAASFLLIAIAADAAPRHADATPLVPPASMSDEAAPSPPFRVAQAETPVSYTAEQVARGLTAYTASCRDCHGANLDDGEFGGAPIRGSYFETRYGDLPASALFDYISSTMPPDRPGQLGPATYADIAAYILQRNGYPGGARPFPSDPDGLEQMLLTK